MDAELDDVIFVGLLERNMSTWTHLLRQSLYIYLYSSSIVNSAIITTYLIIYFQC